MRFQFFGISIDEKQLANILMVSGLMVLLITAISPTLNKESYCQQLQQGKAVSNKKQLTYATEVYSNLGGKRDVRTGERIDGEVSLEMAQRLADSINEEFNKQKQT